MYLNSKDKILSKIVFYWQFTLLMQVIEGIAWIQLNNDENIKLVSVFALIFNAMQPIVISIIVRFGMHTTIKYGFTANVMYIALLLSSAIWDFDDISPPDQCNHLDLKYWDASTTTLYMLASLFAFYDIPSSYWALINISIFLGSLFLAMIISSCGVGSLFCWLIFVSGLFLMIAYRIKNINVQIQENKIVFYVN